MRVCFWTGTRASPISRTSTIEMPFAPIGIAVHLRDRCMVPQLLLRHALFGGKILRHLVMLLDRR